DGLVEKFPETKERLLSGRLELNGIPYNFSGIASKGRLEINSEYGMKFTLGTDSSGPVAVLEGAFAAAGFPVRFSEKTFEFSTDTSFSYSLENGFNAFIPYFDARLMEGTSSLNPSISFSADINNNAAAFESISYSDAVSTLNGRGSVLYRFDQTMFESADYNFSLGNSGGLEKVSLEGTFVNSLRTPINVGSVLSGSFAKNLSFTLQLNIDSLRSERFFPGSNESDSVNANVMMQGSVSNPFVTIDIPRAVFTLQNKPLTFYANAVIEDKFMSLQNAAADWGDTRITDIFARFDQKTWNGDLTFGLKTNLFGRDLEAKASASLEAQSPVQKGMPEAFNISLDAEEISSDVKKKKKPEKFHLGILKVQDDFILSSSPNIGLSGSVSNYRDVSIVLKNTVPFNMNIDGSVDRDFLNLSFSDVAINPKALLDSVGVDLVNVYKGLAVGAFTITGPLSNPAFYGQIDVANAEFNFPSFFKKKASTPMVSLLMSGSQFYTEPTRCHLQGQPIDVTVNVQMNRLAFESLDVRIQTIEDNYVPLNMNLSEMHIKGDFLADMTISLENDTIGVSGDLTAKNTNAEFGATRLNEIISGLNTSDSEDEEEGYPVDVALHIKTGSRVQISYTTFLRAVVVPGSELDVSYMGEEKRLLLDGEVPIRSGEIIYLNSSFYIKEGEIHFSDDDESFDPNISVVAECKTRDEDSEPVTITLEVDKQNLSRLSPRLSSSPAKSEREIMEILGGIITGNSDNAASLALATGDYAIQTVVIRRLENALRDFFNFDIFSVRAMVVQNAVKQSVNRNSSASGNLVGNYLDGTTVYIGKYFGDSLFADAMLRVDYDKNKIGNEYAYEGISFRPELGFELAAPFAKIRWSLSPDLESIRNMKIVENAALTLSWKFNF
nr:translocation/assembly module TamB [Treponema sp.]